MVGDSWLLFFHRMVHGWLSVGYGWLVFGQWLVMAALCFVNVA